MGGACSSDKQRDNVIEPQPVKQQGAAAAEEGAPREPVAKAPAQHQAEEGAQEAKEPDNDDEGAVEEVDEEPDSDIDDFCDYERTINPANLENPEELDDGFGVKVKSQEELEGDDLFAVEENEGKVCFMAVKPWKGAIVAPTNPPSSDGSAPDQDAKLEWAYGYKCSDTRTNVYNDGQGRVVYPTAGLVVQYDAKNNQQTFFEGHTDDVTCLAQSPADPNVFASGQVATIEGRRATLPHICVFNTSTGEKTVLKRAHKRAVRTLGFSKSGKYLASIGADNDYTLTIWDWQAGTKLASLSADTMPNTIFQLVWKDDEEFVTVGKKHIYFWEFKRGVLDKKRAKLAGRGNYKLQTFLSAAYTEKGLAAVATRDGHVYFFKGDRAARAQPVSKGAVISVTVPKEGGIIAGDKYGNVSVFDARLDVVNNIVVEGAVVSLTTRSDSRELLVGTSKGNIIRVEDFLADPSISTTVVSGHHDGELWGIAMHPTDSTKFATAGEDNVVAVWDSTQHAVLAKGTISDKKGKRRRRRQAATTSAYPSNQCARAIAYSPDGNHLAVGTNEGELVLYNASDLSKIKTVDLNAHGKAKVIGKKGNWIQTIKYSPDGRVLAVGTHGMVICLLDVNGGYNVEGVLKAHNAAITHLDWSIDSKHIQSNCVAYELLFHDVPQNIRDSQQNKDASALRDVQWATQSCVLGWPVQGVFDPTQDGTDVNTAARSPDNKLLATGDDYGNVNLFRYPAADLGSAKHVKTGHSSHVMKVEFSNDGNHLFSAGGGDATILQWRLS